MTESPAPKVWQKYSDARPPMVGDQIRLHGGIEKWRGKPLKVSFIGKRHDPVLEREQHGVWVETVGRDGQAHHRVFRVEVLEWYGELLEPAKAPEAAAPPPPAAPVDEPKRASKGAPANAG